MPELEPPLLRARILADHELPREHICLECRTQSFGCLLSIGLMLRSTTVRAAVLRSRKDPAGVRADLVGQVLVDRGPPMPRCCFVLDPARIVFSPAEAEATVTVDMPIGTEPRQHAGVGGLAH